jgi:uncharacterized membrane protein YczE
VTAVIYGFVLDFFVSLTDRIPADTLIMRAVLFAVGIVTAGFGIAMFFITYISPEAYVVFVKDLAAAKGYDVGKTKTVYDFSSLALCVVLSFCFFGLFEFKGIGVGTAITACLNGTLIGLYSKFFKKHFEFKDAFPMRKFFER